MTWPKSKLKIQCIRAWYYQISTICIQALVLMMRLKLWLCAILELHYRCLPLGGTRLRILVKKGTAPFSNVYTCLTVVCKHRQDSCLPHAMVKARVIKFIDVVEYGCLAISVLMTRLAYVCHPPWL